MPFSRAQQAILDKMAKTPKDTGELPYELREYREKIHAAEEKYQGWANRETWAIALHFGNDEGLYNLAKELVEQAKATAERDWRGYQARDPKNWSDRTKKQDIDRLSAENFKDLIGSWLEENWEAVPDSPFKLMVRDMHPDHRIDWRAFYNSVAED